MCMFILWIYIFSVRKDVKYQVEIVHTKSLSLTIIQYIRLEKKCILIG